MDCIALLGARVIAYKPILRTLRVAKTVTGTLLASQLLWEYQQQGRQAFHVSDLELSSQTGLTVDEIRHARQDITSGVDGLSACFVYQRRGFPSVGYWDVDREALAARISSQQQVSPQFGPSPEQGGSQFGRRPEQEASVRAMGRTEENPVVEPVRAMGRTGATGQERSDSSSSGHGPLQFGRRPEQSLVENFQEEKSINPSVSPRGGEAPQAAPVTDADGKQGTKRVNARTAELPEELEQHREAIVDFWQAKKSGSGKTAAAFRLLLRELQKIQAEAPEAVAEQLAQGTQSGWASVTYANWQKYGRETRQTRNGSGLAHGGYGSKAQQNAAEAKRLLNEWDRQGGMFAAAAANNTNTQAALPQGGYPWS